MGQNLLGRTQRGLFLCQLLLGLSLSSHSLHGFTYGLLISQELHRLDRLQVLVQLVEDGDARRQVQLHDGFIGHAYRGQHKQNRSEVSELAGCKVFSVRNVLRNYSLILLTTYYRIIKFEYQFPYLFA